MKKILEFVKNLIIFVYILAIIFVTICLLSYNDYKLTVFGSNTLVPVIDDDLKPNYSVGDLLIIKKNDISEVKPGDSVFFYQTRSGETTINIAKVTDLEKLTESETTLTIEGDFRFSSTNFVGKTDTATVVPKLGMILGTLESKWGFLFLGVFPSLLVFLYTLYSVVLEFYDVKTTGKKSSKKKASVEEDDDDDDDEKEESSDDKKETEDKKEKVKEEAKEKTKEETKEEVKASAAKVEEKAEEKTDEEVAPNKEKEETNSDNPDKEEKNKDKIDMNDNFDVKADMEDLKSIFKSSAEKPEEKTEDEKEQEDDKKENEEKTVDSEKKIETVKDKEPDKSGEEGTTSERKELSAEEKKALIEEKMKTLTPEQKKALIEAKLKSMTPEQKKALIEAKRKKLEEQNNNGE